jgi:hypothetical protein
MRSMRLLSEGPGLKAPLILLTLYRGCANVALPSEDSRDESREELDV